MAPTLSSHSWAVQGIQLSPNHAGSALSVMGQALMDAFIELLRDRPLYDGITVDGTGAYEVLQAIEYGRILFDTYCPECGALTTWQSKGVPKERGLLTEAYKAGLINLTQLHIAKERLVNFVFTCARSSLHQLRFAIAIVDEHLNGVWLDKAQLKRFGQLPALADIAASELDAYQSFIDKADLRELKRATGLAAHGVGIGSFVYLRRIFERMVNEAGQRAQDARGLDLREFSTMRMEEKLQAIKGFVPEWMVENRKLYSILSLGLHELTEEMCQAAFPAVKTGIIALLERAD